MFLYHVTGSAGAGSVTIQHVEFQGVTGTTSSGDKVVLTETGNTVITPVYPKLLQITTLLHGTLVSSGKGIEGVRLVVHTTFLVSTGQLTADILQVSVQCR
jgi:hypothetical protein